MYLKHMHAIETCGFFCQEWFCAQAYVKEGVGALHRGIGQTKQSANKEVVNSRENCGVVDRREVDGGEMETKPRLEKTNKPWMKRNICVYWQS